MNKDFIMNEPCFSDEDRQDYHKYKKIIGDELKPVATRFMSREISFEEALDQIHNIDFPEISRYTVDLFFVLECTAILEGLYEEEGIDKEIFKGIFTDIKCKINECRTVKKVFGTFVIEWYNGFFALTRFCLGRLQYDVAKCDQDAVKMHGFELKNGDFLLSCHIPSSGPLTPELCIESLKMAYRFFEDRINGGVMPVVCSSWLLYPAYREVFGKGSNTESFVRNFKITKIIEKEEFSEAWRVFEMDLDGDLSKLPCKTSLQKNFIEYIKAGNSFGGARGMLLFDGEKVLTRE